MEQRVHPNDDWGCDKLGAGAVWEHCSLKFDDNFVLRAGEVLLASCVAED